MSEISNTPATLSGTLGMIDAIDALEAAVRSLVGGSEALDAAVAARLVVTDEQSA